jgi:hypothetical protein
LGKNGGEKNTNNQKALAEIAIGIEPETYFFFGGGTSKTHTK